jgi:hypothetical protein
MHTLVVVGMKNMFDKQRHDTAMTFSITFCFSSLVHDSAAIDGNGISAAV